MAYRCINLANRGLGMVSRQFRATPERSVAAIASDSIASSSSKASSQRSIDNNRYNVQLMQQRSYSSSIPTNKEYAPNPLDAFRDPVDRQTRMQEPVGRQWSVKELRRKSYEDLHRLWYVLYREKNMLLTEQQLSRRRQLIFPQPDRFQKVQKSMGAIRQVLGERKQKAVAAHLERDELKMTDELESKDTADYLEMEDDESEKSK
mmetsp:Transcript_951/g.1927  ORF Transcript_951/g.1927 Transcript_951/m.1927 type:complete len:205 (-) Transcript_951:160-774(-)|eukprot:CAMPEP_0197273708 /NCGR_PEP_ID=MMETSP1432-20130617/11658_1 /TAXON_ID=44447 /ORGANISM="Pseudo-nitzschia delicatissima, Strain UNC1205" /LENGTH=204 /DNA_ID=CAMNT_0042739411 /DNA_START=20 /DNA_END=634 /DNA_ORIENTATION=+